MNKKIDFFNKDNKNIVKDKKIHTENMSKNPKVGAGSKTAKIQKIKQLPTNPKRRGRRPKKILENINISSESPLENDSGQKNNSAVILRLPFDPSKHIKKINNKGSSKSKTISNPTSNPTSNPDIIDNIDDSSEGMFRNDIPCDNTCHKCVKNEKALALLKSKLEKYEKKEKLDKTSKIYSNKLNFISLTTGKKINIKKTNIKCWWDGHTFTNLPCVLPELFHNNTYHVTGCFCSFNCALAHNLYYLKDSKTHQRKSLTYKLYRELYGLTADDTVDIREAPKKEILEDFGGEMSIDVFRRSFVMIDKEYIVFIPPIKPINITIEERNTNGDIDDNDKEYVLKRSKPLAKKRSVISSMKIKMDDDD